jgi:hypothetical protein
VHAEAHRAKAIAIRVTIEAAYHGVDQRDSL